MTSIASASSHADTKARRQAATAPLDAATVEKAAVETAPVETAAVETAAVPAAALPLPAKGKNPAAGRLMRKREDGCKRNEGMRDRLL
ncbi:hypothetical protein [Bordetella genomosp. 5]|uniref:hypothetical protein n=1 Tax=Bordetella genomosp. 5 TaxID=1395608 RepID=UPI001595467E|nr:hypothetical protein [Bordetella genomosp. 5]